ncbi:MFS transporter, DHA2 family, multidrug resistance protein [Arboricoccus pini]|uniref:MFS transporter, DHA2 family, multidrug resistance protein n=1 Tax=Arboricoccus pini TaxID=1963835 RepID=A0A212RN86_9PROT|nr:MFS transporter [Arboricoccus pini]SNB73916.1 MFS transporter, DHA2 family, multidrug resistance protein [Arboricoccus pini]
MATEDGLPLPQRYWGILAIALPLMLSVLDSSIVNVALPSIGHDLGADPATSVWIVKIYLLVVMVLLLPLATLGEIVGYRLISRTGVVIFTAASLACALTRSVETLTLARGVQAVGAAGILSVNVALTRFVYPRALLGRGIGMIALVVATSSAIGPTLASSLLAIGPWPWLFLVNVPLGLFSLLASRTLPITPRHKDRRLDPLSAGLYVLTLSLFIGSIDAIAHSQGFGLTTLVVLLLLVAGFLLFRRQRQLEPPLVPIDLFKIPVFRMSVLTSICSFGALTMAFVALPFFIQGPLGQSEVMTGLLMTPWPTMTGLAAILAGRLADRYPAGLLGGCGLVMLAIGLGLLAVLPPHAAPFDIVWRMGLCGAGFGLFQSPNNRAMIAAAPIERSGAASGMLGTARMLGQTTGAACTALILAHGGEGGFVLTLVVAAIVAAGAAGVSCLRLLPGKTSVREGS